jgi:signal transduction histidine kinase
VRLTARARLTLLSTVLVLAAGILVCALTYVLMLRPRAVSIHLYDSSGEALPPPPAEQVDNITDQVRQATLVSFLTQAGIALAVVTVLAAVLSWLLARRVLRPIRAMSATAQRLSAEHLSERVPVTGPRDELAELAETINGMLNRIERGFAERDRVLESQRMFTANAAHELRTPLTTMRTAIDVTLDGEPTTTELITMAGDVRTAVEQSQRTLDGLLTLARSQAGQGSSHPADLADILTDTIDNASVSARARDIEVRAELRSAPVSGEPTLLERLARNLLDNAVGYNRAGGHVIVETGSQTGRTFLRVANTGPPVTEASRLLEPFVRGEPDRTHTDGGTGLGLSIVRAIVVAHHGDITVVANPTPTGGLTVTAHFPLVSR